MRVGVISFALALAGASIALGQTAPVGTRRIVPADVKPTGRRLALVIGNEAYAITPLQNPVRDARAVAAALRDLFFEVTEAENLSLPDLDRTASAFSQRLHPGDVALFYYSGHGIQLEGENYLVPVDFKATSEVEAKYASYPANRLHEGMNAAGASLSILILDACRDNPYRRSKGGPAGWAPMQSGTGSLIAFATSPGATASDNGLYSHYLVAALGKPGLRILDVFQETAAGVIGASGGHQSPWFAASVVGDFRFRDPSLIETRLAEQQAQIAKLEAEKKAAEEARQKAKTEQERREAEARASQAQTAIDARKAEQDRLNRDATRQREIADEMARLDREAKDREAAREREILANEETLRTLRTASAPQAPPDMTLDQARATRGGAAEEDGRIARPGGGGSSEGAGEAGWGLRAFAGEAAGPGEGGVTTVLASGVWGNEFALFFSLFPLSGARSSVATEQQAGEHRSWRLGCFA